MGAIIESKYYQPEPGCVDMCGGIIITIALGLSLIFGILMGLMTTYLLQTKKSQNTFK